jgi:hypothetical protein
MTASPPKPSLLKHIGARQAAPPWGVVTALIAPVAAFMAFVAGTFAAQVWLEGQPFVLLAGWTIGALLTTIFVLWWKRRPADRAALKLAPGTTPLPFVLFLAFGAALAIDLLALSVTGRFLPSPETLGVNLRLGGPVEWVFAIAFLLVAQPFAEELVFRGLSLPALRASLGPWAGLVVTAVLSAMFHVAVYPASYAAFGEIGPFAVLWYSAVTPFLAALVLGVFRVVTGSTRSAIAAHTAFGLFALLKLLVGF